MSGQRKRADRDVADQRVVISVKEASKRPGSTTVFVDTRNYWKYVKGHIPGAVNLELYAFHWVDTSRAGLSAFANQMVSLLGSFGIDNTSEVIFYQNNSGYDAARGVWLLNYLGNRNAKMLDGGLNLWKRMGQPISAKDAVIRPKKFVPRIDPGSIATLDFLLRVVRRGSESIQVIDTRTAGEYAGNHRRAPKAGHLPNAINAEWSSALRRDGTLKDPLSLQRLYRAKQLRESCEIVTYCQSGYRAAHTWLVLRLLGFKRVRNYIGSWYEWGSNPSTAVVRR